MLYQDYKAKINRRVKIRRVLRKYRVPIICALSAIIMLLAAFMITKGMIFGDGLELTKIEYGNTPSFTANAVFSDVRYEFCTASEGRWSTEVPVHMGDYKMRVVANGVFGERYSEEQAFSIVPRNINVVAKENDIVYGEKPSATASLAFTDRVYCDSFVFEDTTKKTTTVTPVKDKIVVRDEKGRDVTHCYNVVAKPKSITFIPRDIELTVESSETEYNGEYFKHEVWDITGGELAFTDDVIKIVEDSFASIKGVGSTENKGEFRVIRGGVDVTHQYNITQKTGTLTITQRPVVVVTPDKEFTYTGTERYDMEFSVSESTPLVDGHTIAISDIVARLVSVGEMENQHKYTIRDKEENNVTDNYCITHVSGKLRVLPREVTVATKTESVPYTGEEYVFGAYEIASETKLAVGHEFKLLSQIKATNAVEGLENVIELDIVDGNGESVKGNYVLSYENGTITINKKKIEITSADLLNGVYNGKAQGAESVTYDQGELISGHRLVVTYKSSVTECLAEPVDNEFNVVILGSNDEPVTENYDIVKHNGKLQLQPLAVSILTASASKIYDGTELFATGFTYVDGSPEFINGHTVECVEKTVITNAEYVENKLSFKVLENGEDKSFNYSINVIPGTLSIERRPIHISSKGFDDLKYYDGEEHRRDGEDAIEITTDLEFALVDGHEVRVEFLDTSYVATAVADVENRFKVLGVFLEGTEDSVTGNYAISSSFGILHLEKRPVAFESLSMPTDEDNRVIYDGKNHSVEECVAVAVDEENLLLNMGLVSGHKPVGYGYTRIVDAEELDNTFYVYDILDANDNSVFDNYTITGYKYGKLKVFPRPIILISESDSKVYDGVALTKTDGITIGGQGLPKSQYLVVVSSASITDVLLENGEVVGIPNTFEYEIKWVGNNTTVRAENYVVVGTEYGTLTVTKRPITVTTYDADKIYDGTALKNELANVTSGTIADNQAISFDSFAALTDVMIDEGQVVGITNSCTYKINWIGGAEVKLTNYAITESFGELLVNKRPASIQILSPSKEYDGLPLLPSGFIASAYATNSGFLATHTVNMDLTGEITKVGSLPIGHSDPLVTDTNGGDKTFNYEITVYDGNLAVTKRQIMLDARQEEVEYTGDVITPTFNENDVYHTDMLGNVIGGLGLGSGDRIAIEFKGTIGPELGLYDAEIDENKIFIYNQAGENVTACYDIHQILDGSVRIIPRKIIINIKDGYKEYYDGAPVVSAGFEVVNFLDRIHEIDLTILGSQTNVTTNVLTGEKELGVASLKAGSITIVDKLGNDASAYYEIVEVTNGALEVEKPRPITVTSASAFFPYDGAAHSKQEYTLVDNCPYPMQREEEEVVVFNGEEALLPGAYDNSFTIDIFIKGTAQSTRDNYEITCEYGEIVIGSIDISVTTEGGSKVYDGAPLTNPNASYDCPSEGTIPGLVINIVPTGAQTDVIKLEDGTFGGGLNTYEINASINGRPLTAEAFNIVAEDLGELIVTPMEIEVHTDSQEDFYGRVYALIGGYSLVGWDGSEASNNLNITVNTPVVSHIDRVTNTPTIYLYDKITGQRVSNDNFVISEKSTFGTLVLRSESLIRIESDSGMLPYTGAEQSVEKIKYVNGFFNSAKHRVDSFGFLSFIDVGDHVNEFQIEIVDRETGESVRDLYTSVVLDPDIVTIYPRDIVITAPNVVERYEEGAVLYAPDKIVTPNEYIEELNMNFDNNEYGYEIDWSLATSERPSVTGNLYEKSYVIPSECFFITLNGKRLPQNGFNIICHPGTLKLSDKLIEIFVPSVSDYYNGSWLGYYADDWYVELPEEYRMELDLSIIGLDEIGSIDFDEMYATLRANNLLNLYYTDVNGVESNVTDEFDYKFVGEPLTLNKIELTVTAGSSRKCYDGKPLVCDEYTIAGSLLPGHVVKECKVVGSIVGRGYERNQIDYVTIVDTNSKDSHGNYIDVTHLYKIQTVDGLLEIFENGQE